MEHGSLQNMMYANAGIDTETIEVGMGATYVMWSDREPYTVIDIYRFKTGPNAGKVKGVKVQADNYKRLDNGGPFTESQEYEFSPNPNGITHDVFLMKDGRWKIQYNGGNFMIGSRMKYYDPTF